MAISPALLDSLTKPQAEAIRTALHPKPTDPSTPSYSLPATQISELALERHWSLSSLNLPSKPDRILTPAVTEGSAWLFAYSWGSPQTFLIRVQLSDFTTEVIPAPPGLSQKVDWITVREDCILLQGSYCIAVYNRAKRSWVEHSYQYPQIMRAYVMSGSTEFFIIEENQATLLMACNLKDGSLKLLASNRRTPSKSPLDDPAFKSEELAIGAKGELLILSRVYPKGQCIMAYAPESEKWEADIDTSYFNQSKKKHPSSSTWCLQQPASSGLTLDAQSGKWRQAGPGETPLNKTDFLLFAPKTTLPAFRLLPPVPPTEGGEVSLRGVIEHSEGLLVTHNRGGFCWIPRKSLDQALGLQKTPITTTTSAAPKTTLP